MSDYWLVVLQMLIAFAVAFAMLGVVYVVHRLTDGTRAQTVAPYGAGFLLVVLGIPAVALWLSEVLFR